MPKFIYIKIIINKIYFNKANTINFYKKYFTFFNKNKKTIIKQLP